jgi:hypothetical protein
MPAAPDIHLGTRPLISRRHRAFVKILSQPPEGKLTDNGPGILSQHFQFSVEVPAVRHRYRGREVHLSVGTVSTKIRWSAGIEESKQ